MIFQKTYNWNDEKHVYTLWIWFTIFNEPGACPPPTADDPKLTDRLVCQVSYCILGLCKRPCTGWVGGNGLSLPGLKDASDSLAKRGFFLRKKPRSILKLQKWVLELWRRTSGQKASILFKAFIGVHFITVRAPCARKLRLRLRSN